MPGNEPRVVRPDMSNYGVPHDLDGSLPWSWAEQRLVAAHNYWVSTVNRDGRPNASAVWGLWMDGKFFFSCSPAARKAKNLASNPHCVITTEAAHEAVIVEGEAQPIRGRDALAPYISAYKQKYDWDMDPENDGYFLVTPRVGFVFVEYADRFAKTATKYEFPS